MNSSTLREAGLQLKHYAPLICEKFQMDLREEGRHAFIIHRVNEIECSASLASTIQMIRHFTGIPINPI